MSTAHIIATKFGKYEPLKTIVLPDYVWDSLTWRDYLELRGDKFRYLKYAFEKFKSRRRQGGTIGIFSGGLIIDEGGGGTTPAFSDIEIVQTVSSGISNAAIVFHDDRAGAGSDDPRILTKRHNTVYTDMGDDDATVPVDHTGEWTTDAITESAWEVACTVEVIGTWDFPFASVGVFTGLDTADMEWRENRTGGKGYTPGTDRCVGTFFIREVADTGNSDNQIIDVSAVQT